MAMSMAAGSTFGIVAQSAAVVDVLKEVKAEYAPDTRVAVWSVMAKTVDGVEVLTGDVDNQSAKSDILARLDKLNIKFEDKIKILPEATVKGPWALVSISVACVRGAAAGCDLLIPDFIAYGGLGKSCSSDEYFRGKGCDSLCGAGACDCCGWRYAD